MKVAISFSSPVLFPYGFPVLYLYHFPYIYVCVFIFLSLLTPKTSLLIYQYFALFSSIIHPYTFVLLSWYSCVIAPITVLRNFNIWFKTHVVCLRCKWELNSSRQRVEDVNLWFNVEGKKLRSTFSSKRGIIQSNWPSHYS